MVCPHAAIRTKVYDPAAARRSAPAASRPIDYKARASSRGRAVHAPGRAGGLHRLRPVRGGLPGEGQGEPEAQGDRHAPAAPHLATPSGRASTFFLQPARGRSHDASSWTSKGSQFLRAAVRVLRRLRGLRRDAVRQAAHPALRRPRADRQRHRLLLDLRRQPARPRRTPTNRDGRGPAWSNSLFEDNAEFGLGMRLAVDAHETPGRGAARRRSARQVGDELVARDPRRPTRTTRRASRPSGRAWWPLRGEARRARRRRRRRRARRRSPTTWCKKSVWIVGGDGWAYDIGYGGLDHVLASARERERPGARHRGLLQHRRPAVQGHADRRRRRSSPPPARRSARRTSACSP